MIDSVNLRIELRKRLEEVKDIVEEMSSSIHQFLDDNGLDDTYCDDLIGIFEDNLKGWDLDIELKMDDVDNEYSEDDIIQMGRDFARDRLFGDGDDPTEFSHDMASYAVDMAAGVFDFASSTRKGQAADLMLIGMSQVLKERRSERL